MASDFLGAVAGDSDTVMLETARDASRTTRRTTAPDDTLEADHVIMPHVSEPTVKEAKRRRLSFAERIARELAPTKDCLLDKGAQHFEVGQHHGTDEEAARGRPARGRRRRVGGGEVG